MLTFLTRPSLRSRVLVIGSHMKSGDSFENFRQWVFRSNMRPLQMWGSPAWGSPVESFSLFMPSLIFKIFLSLFNPIVQGRVSGLKSSLVLFNVVICYTKMNHPRPRALLVNFDDFDALGCNYFWLMPRKSGKSSYLKVAECGHVLKWKSFTQLYLNVQNRCLLHKHYWNRDTLRGQNPPLKCC